MIQLAPPLAGQSDEALFARYASCDDQEAIRLILQRYEEPVKGFLRKRVQVEAEVDDLWSDTVLRLVRAKESYDPSRKFSTWVYTIAGNLVKNEFRNRARRRQVLMTDYLRDEGARELDRELAASSTFLSPEEDFSRRDAIRRVRETIAALPERHRAVLVLRDLEDATYEQMAERMEVPPGTVKSRLNRARAVFAEEYRARNAA